MDKAKNIVILTAVHPYKAAGIVAFDIMQGLKENGANVVIITNVRLEKNYENTISLKSKTTEFICKVNRRISKLLSKKIPVDRNYYMFGLNQNSNDFRAKRVLKKLPFKPDAFIYLFPQFFLSAKDLFYLNKNTKAPILWYLMDMAAFTGGCHFAHSCTGYIKTCGNCPGIYSNSKKDQTHLNWVQKKSFIEQTDIIPIAASEWTYNQLKRSSLYKNKECKKILIPISSAIFKPGNKDLSRKSLGLPLSKKIILFGSVSVKENRKGFKELMQSLSILYGNLSSTVNENILIIIAGNSEFEYSDSIPFDCSTLGYLNYTQLALAYQAADIFLCPSIEDSGPTMINQSIMCCTPVVSFDMGVASDLVFSGKTGYRAKLKDCSDFADGIKSILELKENNYLAMRDNCKIQSQISCNPISQTEKIIELLNRNSFKK